MAFDTTTVITASLIVMVLLDVMRSADAGTIAAGSAVAACYTACNAGYASCMGAVGLCAGMWLVLWRLWRGLRALSPNAPAWQRALLVVSI
jgi:hypothetical protein